MTKAVLSVAVAALLLSPTGSCAGIAGNPGTGVSRSNMITFFDDFPYTRASSYVICGETGPCGIGESVPAVQFVSTMTGTATKVVVPISAYGFGYPSNVHILVREDRDGSPGKVLAKRNVTAPPCCTKTTVRVTARLAYGTAYWVEIAPQTEGDLALWNVSVPAQSCTMTARHTDVLPNWPCPAVEISGAQTQTSGR